LGQAHGVESVVGVVRRIPLTSAIVVTGALTGDLSVQNFELVGDTTTTPATFSGMWGIGPAPSVPDLSVKTTKVRC
jgi:hypothetical protein